jgi:hypothetical protein
MYQINEDTVSDKRYEILSDCSDGNSDGIHQSYLILNIWIILLSGWKSDGTDGNSDGV